MSEEQVINCMGSKTTSERRGGHSSWALQDKWEFARRRRLQAGGSACWFLGVATVRFCCGVAQEQKLRECVGEACLGAWTASGKQLKCFKWGGDTVRLTFGKLIRLAL